MRSASRRLKALLIGGAVALVVVAGLVIVAINSTFERRLAEESQRLALIQNLTFEARHNLERTW